MKILVIEDYKPLRETVVQALLEEGYAVESTGDGAEGLWFAEEFLFEVIVLDIMLPSLNGLEILKKLRDGGNPVNVLILTAKDSIEDRVKGLDLGADDYLVKPFAIRELLSRINVLIRRSSKTKSSLIAVADLNIDLKSHIVTRGGVRLDLSTREYQLLELLALQEGRFVSREDIWDRICDFAAEINSNLIDVYISNLRKKIESGGKPRLIFTQRGMGYYLGEKS